MPGSGHNLDTPRNRELDSRLAAWRAENARRVPCPRCHLLVLPETMRRHAALHHGGRS